MNWLLAVWVSVFAVVMSSAGSVAAQDTSTGTVTTSTTTTPSPPPPTK